MHIFGYTISKDKEATPLNISVQLSLIVFTLSATLLVSLELPEYGVLINGIAQIFWLYNAYLIYRDDKTQWGMPLLSVIMSFVVVGGILNYWFFV